jgi:hypothetical protein
MADGYEEARGCFLFLLALMAVGMVLMSVLMFIVSKVEFF